MSGTRRSTVIHIKYFVYLLFIGLVITSCGGDSKKSNKETEAKKVVSVPDFNADSAYHFVAKQVEFGPRVPGTEAHEATKQYLISTFKAYGAEVKPQEFTATTFDNQQVQLTNIMASFNPKATKRILLASHWDARPFADKDSVRKYEPIDAANDGASGVGVLLEVARVLHNNAQPEVGIDLMLFDGEDWGETQGADVPTPQGLDTWWCLGSQYWAKNKGNYSAYYGILLDMVGGKNAKFYVEGMSKYYASSIVDKVWNKGIELGFSNYFIKQPGGQTTDDHVFVNEYAKIPMIDIIAFNPKDGGFGDFHHTHQDNMSLISKETLDAVGETLLHVVYYE
ncbi:M28 family peptidase [Fulvivirga maritima]|uniref:M28 family peptidase n=1 Tax=Fulvivirga maritima TaxID=2904247 RepID=UPI001F379365|nr:M28 family peptidase [Fulvivirga maritima]UII28641.1 M28 family peptidase [Fulvivirga maritima]